MYLLNDGNQGENIKEIKEIKVWITGVTSPWEHQTTTGTEIGHSAIPVKLSPVHA